MSFNGADRRRTCRLYWCYECRRALRIISFPSSDVFCPRCYGRFLHEIDHFPPFPRPLRQFPPGPHFHSDDLPSGGGRWVIFGNPSDRSPPSPPPPPRQRLFLSPPVPTSPVMRRSDDIPPAVDPADYFTGPNLNTLIDELTQNDRPGPPPAESAAIAALPSVLIAEAHLRDGSQCPVCKEEFELGEEAREMPCNHVYHSDCIVPWLRLHNSCPVCRFQLPGGGSNSDRPRGARSDVDSNESRSSGSGRERRWPAGRWNPLGLLWPFWDAWPRWDDERGRRDEAEDDLYGGPGAFYSWWRSLFIL
ncbi:probable E3 ubiquitin-protein ligase RHC1A [Ananas comosus]|uniref:RING-type E3 ubiquitin transferase n=1 Tax=Ananas comosus TaxID=4615 RepID=A0A6P5F8Y4_ANACO|nr:probable E3 ubiquitin-protein ligase RHC1A [Ananas comosus]